MIGSFPPDGSAAAASDGTCSSVELKPVRRWIMKGARTYCSCERENDDIVLDRRAV
jgi:hypothetical protein